MPDIIHKPGVPYYTNTGEKRIDGMNKAEMLHYKILIAKAQVQQMFCDHKKTTRIMMEQSNERVTCLSCDKVWYD